MICLSGFKVWPMDIDEQDLAATEREAERLRRRVLAAADFRKIAELVEGRRFLRRLLAECGVHQSTFCGEPLSMAFREGRRSVGLWVQGQFDGCPDLYIRLLQQTEAELDELHVDNHST
jgi:hypothetical protein